MVDRDLLSSSTHLHGGDTAMRAALPIGLAAAKARGARAATWATTGAEVMDLVRDAATIFARMHTTGQRKTIQ